MKRFVLVAVLVGILALALASTAFAQGPVAGTQPGVHTPGTGLANGTVTGAGPMAVRQGARGGMGYGGMRGAPAWDGQPDEVETLLGLTDDEIRAERLAGKSLAQIAATKDISRETLVNTILSAKKAALDHQVAAGQLTQAQADTIYARMQQQVPAMVERTDIGPGRGPVTGTRLGLGGRWNR